MTRADFGITGGNNLDKGKKNTHAHTKVLHHY